MNNNDERDYDEEQYNRELMEEEQEPHRHDERVWEQYADTFPEDSGYVHLREVQFGSADEILRSKYLPNDEESTFWYLQNSPTVSGYDWLLYCPIFTQLLSPDGEVLVYDDSRTFAAILDTEMRHMVPDAVLTANVQIINWGRYYPKLRALVDEARKDGRPWRGLALPKFNEPIIPDHYVAMPAPGQKENNVVNKLDCGHELDTEDELEVGTTHYCSVHGMVMVIR